ncbi:MAG: RecQ family ATP-dependent DNA helicase [Bacteroidaceae bacterium]|nr:RecQ family ATP-dependent DNA helicase [Bacteroidaceae bacterium]
MPFRSILQQYWGYPDFRGIQADIICSIAEGRDTLGLMPTGGGKSITFQVPALSMEGVCIVVTPLIALMKDQVLHLKQRGITAEAIFTGQSKDEVMRILDNAVFGGVKFLYISPERIASELFQRKVRGMKVCFITVDEAHCISQWGYDFRPAYLKIAELRKLVPDVPILALTATATPQVVDDIQDCLGFREKNAFRMSFERKNLRYIVRTTANKFNELIHILRCVEGPAIVYTRSRQGTIDVAQALTAEGFSALHYHAGLSNVEKDVRQRSWQEDDTRVMVATNAFGMGIDKPDVRLVIHLEAPDSIEAYFQEAGRAGRDGKCSYAVLLREKGDDSRMIRTISENFPELDYVRKIYDDLANFFQMPEGEGEGVMREFQLEKFCVNFRRFPIQVESALRILELAGYLHYREAEENVSRVIFLMNRDDLYRQAGLTPLLDRVLNALLRHYCGLFADYVMIDEEVVAKSCGCTPREVYEQLKELTHMRVLNYIPKKCSSYITYLTRRLEGRLLLFPPIVYKHRKENYIKRINCVMDYASRSDVCRSVYLLDYFGEKEANPCGGCDVCLDGERNSLNPQTIAENILQHLSDGKPHPAGELTKLCSDVPTIVKRQAWDWLVEQEYVELKDGYIRSVRKD